jgi:transglutaminase-like putative cysteine protease
MSEPMRRSLAFFAAAAVAAALLPLALRAQAPDITPSGDPSVKDDTIYKLAVDSADYPQQSWVLLLDDGVVKVERDGRSTTTYRQVIQILRDRAVASHREQEWGYDADRQHFRLNWARVLTPDGKVVSDKPSQMQESDIPAAMDVPMYQHAKVVRASLSGVAVGTVVDVSYTIETRSVDRTGDFFNSWRVTAGSLVRRSRFIVDAPADMPLTIVERHLTFPRHEQVGHGRRVYAWATKEVAWTKPEQFAPDTVQQVQTVSVSAPGHWSDVGSWYAGLAHDRELPPDALRDTVRRLIAHATTRDDSIRAVHRWVAQDIRYVAVELGRGGYQPRLPATVMQTGFGDCKDKATLFVAAMRTIGIDAYPVLLNAGGYVDSALTTIKAFNHEIAAIARPGRAGYQFVDLTSEFNPYGTVPYADEGEFGLLVRPDGHTEEVRIPTDPPGSDEFLVHQTVTLMPDGTVSGWFEQRGTGIAAMPLRAAMQTPMDSTRRAEFMRSIAGGLYPDAQGDSLVVFNGKDLTATPRIAGQAVQQSGGTAILNLASAGGAAKFDRIADELAAAGPRKMAIDAKQVIGPVTVVGDIRITLPVGWKVRLPANDSAASEFGTYVAHYSQQGRDFVISRRISGATGVYPPEKIGDLIAWLRAAGADRTPFVIIDTVTTAST